MPPSYPSLPQLVLLSEREAATQGHSPTSSLGVVASVIPEKSKEISTVLLVRPSEPSQPTHLSHDCNRGALFPSCSSV
ncbi:MAG: hypothetical protein R3E08_13495 [Thiotrichaceae bacterium]